MSKPIVEIGAECLERSRTISGSRTIIYHFNIILICLPFARCVNESREKWKLFGCCLASETFHISSNINKSRSCEWNGGVSHFPTNFFSFFSSASSFAKKKFPEIEFSSQLVGNTVQEFLLIALRLTRAKLRRSGLERDGSWSGFLIKARDLNDDKFSFRPRYQPTR